MHLSSISRAAHHAVDQTRIVRSFVRSHDPFTWSPRPLSQARIGTLIASAAAHPTNEWQINQDISTGRNKHRTDTPKELSDGLVGSYDWLEADVRERKGVPVAAHGRRDSDPVEMRDWLQIGQASQRGLKFDFKERRAIDPTITMVRQLHVPDQRLLLNVTVLSHNRVADVYLPQLRRLRAEFPDSWINLSLPQHAYSPALIARAVALAHTVGGKIMFPLDAQFVTPQIVREFRAGGRVAIWNDPETYAPANLAATRAKYRRWGANGIIDLRPHGDNT